MDTQNLRFQLKQVDLKIEGTFILNNISLDVQENERVFILGNNGSGKSSLIEVLLDNIKASGQILRHLPAKRHIGLLFDQVPFSPLYKVKEVVHLYGLLFHLHQSAYQPILERLNLPAIMNKKIGKLSTGERKRLGLFAALFHNPQLLLLDEPLSGIDPNSVQQINELIFAQPRTVIIASHDWESAVKYADKIAFLHQGTLLGGSARSPAAWLSEDFIPFTEKVVIQADSGLSLDELKRFAPLTIRYDNKYVLFGFEPSLLDWLYTAKITYARAQKSLHDIYYYLMTKNELEGITL